MTRSTLIKRLIFGFALVNVLTALIVVLSLAQSHQKALRETGMAATSLAQIMERTLSGVVSEADIVLLTCAEEIELQLAQGKHLDETALTAFLQRQYKHLPEANALRVVDHGGNISNGVGPTIRGRINIADRDYFLRARDEPQTGLIFSKPLQARSAPIWSIFLARRISRADGAFAGLVYIGIPLERFTSLFASLYVGPKGTIALIDLDKTLITRHPPLARGDMRTEPLEAPDALVKAHQQNPNAGIFSLSSPLDGIERVVAYRKVSRFPGYLFVSIAKEDYFSAWHRELVTMTLLMGLVIAVTGTVAWLLFSRWKQQEAHHRDLVQQSRTDALTDCSNRRHLMEMLQTERLRTLRYAKGFCLLALDLDHFKSINDRFGHLGGDQALRHFADIVRKTLRSLDTFGRMGGEEFCILLPETPLDAAIKIAERIRTELESLPVSLQDTPVALTVSIGAAVWHLNADDSIEALLARADAALYEAKRAGRNVVRAEHGAHHFSGERS